MEFTVELGNEEAFLKALAYYLKNRHSEQFPNLEETKELAKRINRVLPEITEAIRQGKFEEEIESLDCKSRLLEFEEPEAINALFHLEKTSIPSLYHDSQLTKALYSNRIEELRSVCKENKFTQKKIAYALQFAMRNDNRNAVEIICEMANDYSIAVEAGLFAYTISKPCLEWIVTTHVVNQVVIDEVLVQAVKKLDIPFMEKLCAPDIINKPSKAAIEKVLVILAGEESINNEQKSAIAIIGNITSENKPGNNAIIDALTVAIKNDLPENVEQLCQSEGYKRLDKFALSSAVQNQLTFRSIAWSCIIFIVDNYLINQETIDNLVLKAAEHYFASFVLVEKLCSPQSKNKPSRTAVDNTLILLTSYLKLEYSLCKYVSSVTVLCAMTGENKPSKNAIAEAVQIAIDNKQLANVQELCQVKGDNQLDKLALSSAVQNQLSLKSIAWSCINFIVDNYFINQETIDNLLVKAAEHFKSEDLACVLIEKLCSPESKNKPSKTAVDNTLILLAPYLKLEYSLCKYVSSVTVLCAMTSENKPSKNAIAEAVQIAIDNKQRANVQDLCQIKGDNQLDKLALSSAVQNQLSLKSIAWSCINFIVDNYFINQETIDNLLVKAAEHFKSEDLACVLIEKLCSPESKNKPSKTAVDNTLILLAPYLKLEYSLCKYVSSVTVLCAMTGENKPSKNAIAEAFRVAMQKNRRENVEKLCQLKGENQLDHQAYATTVQTSLKEKTIPSSCLTWIAKQYLNFNQNIVDEFLKVAVKHSETSMVEVICNNYNPSYELCLSLENSSKNISISNFLKDYLQLLHIELVCYGRLFSTGSKLYSLPYKPLKKILDFAYSEKIENASNLVDKANNNVKRKMAVQLEIPPERLLSQIVQDETKKYLMDQQLNGQQIEEINQEATFIWEGIKEAVGERLASSNLFHSDNEKSNNLLDTGKKALIENCLLRFGLHQPNKSTSASEIQTNMKLA